MKIITSLAIACLVTLSALSQTNEIKIEEERIGKRIMLYGVNETFTDLDVTVEVTGTGFRQSARQPRAVRIPATSKVHLMNIMMNKGETPKYEITQIVTDSLSRRALRKEATTIKVPTKRPIVMYITEACVTCDSIVAKLDRSPYKYTKYNLAENEAVKSEIARVISRLDTIKNPIVSDGRGLNLELDTFDKLMEKFNK